jgi:hypothetical protein
MSKKYRRNVARPAAPSSAPTVTTQTIVPPKATPKNTSTAIPVPTAASFRRDLTFIGLTTLIVVILMVIAFYVVPH